MKLLHQSPHSKGANLGTEVSLEARSVDRCPLATDSLIAAAQQLLMWVVVTVSEF